MKRSISLWKVFITLLLLVMLGLMITILNKVNRCCNCNEKREIVFTGHLNEVYDSLTHKKGITAFMNRLSIGEKGDTIVTTFNLATLWFNCPEKEAVKAPVILKKSTVHLTKKVTKTSVVKKMSSKKDTCSSKGNVTITNNNFINEKPRIERPKNSGLLKIDLESTKSNKTISLYSQVSALPSQSFGTHSITQFNYDVIPDLHIQEYIKRAKKHLWIGTGLASAGAITYASTWFNEVPTFVEYNGLGYFDPANKYYDHNMHERERLNTLKWVRGISVGVGILGGVEVIHGIILLKNADLSIAPEKIILRYSF